jgi:hypothetical protein
MIICPTRKGKGHVLDFTATICLTILGPLLALAEHNDPKGTTREKCKQCRGKGFIEVK